MSAKRLPSGGEIDRAKPVTFTFDGRKVQGFEGDTVASALLANNIRLVGRSFKYHRPRGLWGHGSEEPNALVDLSGTLSVSPNNRATVIHVAEGLAVRSVNSKPDAENDKFSYLDRFSRFIPAAFYYKTFMFPDWHLFEPRIREMAGLGAVDSNWKKSSLSAQINAHPDLLVIGAGPAGLAAALATAEAGRKVLLVDEKSRVGGSLLYRDRMARINGFAPGDWIANAMAKLDALGATILTDTTAFGIYDHGLIGLNQKHADRKPDTLWRVRPSQTILAAGAIERPLPFANNDLPGVMSADAGLAYLHRYGVLAGEDVVIATNNSSAIEVALAYARAGAKVHLVDLRTDADHSALIGVQGIILHPGRRVTEAYGRNAVAGVVMDDGSRLSCDCVLASGGFSPTIHLYGQARGKLKFDEQSQMFMPGIPVEGLSVAGAANGRMTLAGVITDGLASVVGLPLSAQTGTSPSSGQSGRGAAGDGRPIIDNAVEQYSIAPAWPEPGQKGRVWIDFQNDVTAKDVELAARENFVSVEHLKRYTTLGMATDQGKTSNLNGLALMGKLTGRTIPEVGTTTYRPPFTPVPLASFAGKKSGILNTPVRRLPLETRHRADGAVFQDYGGWLRPAYFGSGEPDAEITREVEAARNSVALFDGSTLGKIEVIGPDAAEFLDFMFYNTVSTLKPGKCRYCFILTETGIVYDDGVIVRLSDTHFIVSCSSSHVAGVYSMLEDWRQDRFDRSRVFIHNSTPHFATLTVTGPKSRDVMAATDIAVALDDIALPHMAFVEGNFHDAPVRVARVSFTGDRSYEITIRADRADALWMHLRDRGAAFGATLMGSEALLILRAEKGYIIVGKDTDGLTRPVDLGLTAPLKNKKVEFLGKRSLLMEDAQRPDRKEYVGLEVIDGDEPFTPGAHGVEMENGKHRSIGYVTSSYLSPTLKRPIALGLIERGISRHGEIIDVRHFGAVRKAKIVAPCALDPEGARLHA